MSKYQQTTAATAYAYHQGLTLSLLARIKPALDAHAVAAAAKPGNWGFSGDLEAAAAKLLEALAALDAATPVERLQHRV